MPDSVFDRIAIIGAGLLGASIALAAEGAEIALYDADPSVRQRAKALGLGIVSDTIEECVTGADCIILCTPVGTFADVTQKIAPFLKPGATLTDVGSVKGQAALAMAEHCPKGVHVIPGHPIAGTEKSGPDAGFASLFEGRWHILTPPEGFGVSPDEAAALARLKSFWESLGATVEIMDPVRHDRVLAITSHLPHLIAYNIVSTAYDMESVDEGEVVKYSAGGFRDFTRIAASDPTMWRDVFLSNKEAVLETLGRFSEDLAALQRAIRWGDGDMLFREFSRAKGIRQAIIDAGQESDAVNFGRNMPSDDEDTET